MIRLYRRSTARVVYGLCLLCALLLPTAAPAHAGPVRQDDPAAQCAEGVQLFLDGNPAEALPLLQEGFAGREQATFAEADDLGMCAVALGVVRNNTGDRDGALEAYTVALAQFEASGNREWQGLTLNNIGQVYQAQGRYAEALDYFQQALVMFRELEDKASESVILNNIGVIYRKQGRYDAALEHYQQALAVFRELDNLVGQSNTLNNIGAVHQAQGRYPEALDHYQQTLALDRALDNRAGEGDTLTNIGGVYNDQGRYDAALEHFQQALVIVREVGNRPMEGTTLHNIGLVYDNQGRYDAALEHYQQALVIRREVGDRAGEGATLTNIGGVYANQGRYADALDYYEQALAIAREVGNRDSEGTTLNNIAGVYDSQGRYADALDYYQQALDIRRDIRDRSGEGVTLNNIGVVYEQQGQYAEALDSYQQALAIQREIGDRAGEGTTLDNMGLVYDAQGRYATALDFYQQALAIRRKIGDRTGEGTTLNNLGHVYSVQGRYGEALEQFQHALAIHQEVGNRADEGTTLGNIGGVYSAQERYDAALEQHQQALVIAREIGNRRGESTVLNNIGYVYSLQERYDAALEQHQQALVIAREIGYRPGEGITLNNIGAVYAQQGRSAEALEQFQQALVILRALGMRMQESDTLDYIGLVYAQQGDVAAALESYEQAIAAQEEVRAQAGSEQGRAGFVAERAAVYRRAARLYHQQSQHEQAFLTSERGRARAFLDGIATGTVQVADNTAQELLDQEQAAYTTRQDAQDALALARAADPPDTARIADLEAHLADAEAELSAAREAIAARGDQLAALVPGRTNLPDLADIQAALPSDTTLVAYFIIDDETTLAFVLTRDALHVEELPVGRTELDAQVRMLRAFDDPTGTAAEELYAALIAPLHDRLTTSHLIIVPHGVLHYLPFAALSDGTRALADDYTLTRLPAASLLPLLQTSADVADQDEGTVLLLANQLGPPVVPGVAAAARTIGELYGVEPLLDQDATEAALREQAAQARILHLGAHGVFDAQRPLASHIQLAASDDTDGQLTVAEVYELDLAQTDLVVLSACETQVNQLSNPDDPLAVTAGDDLVGLTRAFFVAGTPTVVATLWQVEDAPSRLLMERFYTYLRDGTSKAEALRRAQLDVRADYPDPYHWAGFVLVGDGGAARPTIPLWAWVAGVPALLALVGVVIAAQRRRARKRAAYGIGPS